MAAALPFVSAGLGLYSAIKGGQAQDQAQGMTEQQLQQQQQIRDMVLGRLTKGPAGNPQNPFSAQYGPIQAPSTQGQPSLQQQAVLRNMGFLK